jgi:hypothetical protein
MTRSGLGGDIESFLHRLAYQESAGLVTPDQRIRICQDLKRTLDRIRALGLVASGQPAAGLGTDFLLTPGDAPQAGQLSRPNPTVTCRRRCTPGRPAEPPEPNRDLPPEILRILCAGLAELERGSCDQRSGPGSNC